MKLILALLYCTFLSANATVSKPEVPRLFFSYSWLYDSTVCEKSPPDQKWVDEILERSESFSNLWLNNGPKFFQVLFDHTGLGFSRKELTATFSVCPNSVSYSNPLVFNMKPYLNSHMNPKTPFGDDNFVDLVFHELLHLWVGEHLKNSELRRKYISEAPLVKKHLHLMAIQKFVYAKMGRLDLIAMLDLNYPRMINKSYARAWEIVNLEGHDVFMSEF